MTDEIDISKILNEFKKELFRFALANRDVKNIGVKFEFYDASKLLENREIESKLSSIPDEVEVKTVEEVIISEKKIIRGRLLNKDEEKCKSRRISEKAREVTIKEELKVKTTYQDITETFRHYITGKTLNRCYIKGIKFHIASKFEENKLAHLRSETVRGNKVLIHVSVLSGNDNLRVFDQIMRDFHKFRVCCKKCGNVMDIEAKLSNESMEYMNY